MQLQFSSTLSALALLALPTLVACGSGGSGGAGSDGDSSEPSGNPSAPNDGASESNAGPSTPTDSGDCSETPLFPPQSFGDDGDDLIRHIEVDADSGDLYFSVLNDMYVLRKNASVPELLGVRPNDDIGGQFWLAGDRILFPSGTLVPLIEGTRAVLYSADRDLAQADIAVSLPVPESYNYDYSVDQVFVLGDDVLWLAEDKYTDNPAAIPIEWQTTYVLRRTSWRNPGEPEDLYATTRMVGTVTIAGGQVFIEEQVSEENFGEWEQTIVDIDSGSKDPQTALEKFGGSVVGGSVSGGEAGSVFVSRLDLDHADDIGLFRTAPDGSDGELLTTNPFVDLLVERGDSWVFVDPGGIGDPILVEQYRPGQGVTLLGCIDGDQTTAHALSLQNDEPVVAIFRTDNSVILKVQ